MIFQPTTHMVFLDHPTANTASTTVSATTAGAPIYPMRREPTSSGGRWTVRLTSSTAPTMTLTLQGRLTPTGPWVTVSVITAANLTTQGLAANNYGYGASIPLWPEMRALLTTFSGTTPLLSAWITG